MQYSTSCTGHTGSRYVGHIYFRNGRLRPCSSPAYAAMLHGRLVGNWSSCWSSMRHCGSWCRHKPATRLKSMQPFFVINSTLIKVPCGKREKYEKTGNAGNPKKQKYIFSSIWWSGLWLLHLWFDRNFTRYRYIYPLYVFFGCRTGKGSLSFQSLFPIPKSEI